MEKNVSWTGGTRIFEAVSEAIEQREEGEISGAELASALIKALKAEGWDAEEASVGLFDEDSPVREALAEHGIFEKCGSEHAVNPWQCEERAGHYPATLHKDYQGNTWSEEEEA